LGPVKGVSTHGELINWANLALFLFPNLA
jgi:hypothetical protein